MTFQFAGTGLHVPVPWLDFWSLPLTTEALVTHCPLWLKAVPIHLKQIFHVNRIGGLGVNGVADAHWKNLRKVKNPVLLGKLPVLLGPLSKRHRQPLSSSGTVEAVFPQRTRVSLEEVAGVELAAAT